MSHTLSYYVKYPNDIDHKTKNNLIKVQQLVASKNFYKTSIYSLIIDVLQFNKDNLNDSLLEIHTKLKQLLNIYNLQVIPPHLAVNQDLHTCLYIVEKINFNNDADIAVVKELNSKANLTNLDLNRINIAKIKINNFNAMLRVFEALFVINKRLTSAQKDFFIDKIYETTLPHEAVRYFIAYFSYISENDNPIYDFKQKDNFFAYLDNVTNNQIIELLATIACKNNTVCTFIKDYPYIEQLIKAYLKLKPEDHAIYTVDNSLNFELLSYYRDLRNIEDIKLQYCSFLLEKVQYNTVDRLQQISKSSLPAIIKNNIVNFYDKAFYTFKGDRQIIDKCLNSFRTKKKDLYILNPENIDILIDSNHLYSTVSQLHFLCKSKDALTCLSYPFIKADCKELINNKTLYNYWEKYEQNALAFEVSNYNEYLFLTNSSLCLYLLPAFGTTYYKQAFEIMKQLKIIKMPALNRIIASFMYLYVIDDKYNETLDTSIKTTILSQEYLRRALFYRICSKYTYIGQIPSNLRFIVNYVLTFDYLKIKDTSYNYSIQAKYDDINNALTELFSEAYATLEIKKLLNIDLVSTYIEQYKYTSNNKTNLLPKSISSHPMFDLINNIIAFENYIFNQTKLEYSDQKIYKLLKSNLNTAINDIHVKKINTNKNFTNNEINTSYGSNSSIDYDHIITSLNILRIQNLFIGPISLLCSTDDILKINIPLLKEKGMIFITYNNIDYDTHLINSFFAIEKIIETFIFIEQPSSNFDNTIQNIVLSLKMTDNAKKMFTFEYCRACFKYYADFFAKHTNHQAYLNNLASNFRQNIQYLFASTHEQDQFLYNIAKTSFKHNNFNPQVAHNISSFFHSSNADLSLLQDILIQQSIYNKHNLDLNKIKQKMRESTEISNVISAIKLKEEVNQNNSIEESLIGDIEINTNTIITEESNPYLLTEQNLKFLNLINEHKQDETITQEQLVNFAEQCNFMSFAVALEEINDISYDNFDEALLDYDEEDSTVYITVPILHKLLNL